MKIFNTKAKTQENTESVMEASEVMSVEGENTDIMEIGDSAIDDLEKVTGTSNEIKQQSAPRAFLQVIRI